jgi:hypothetical protein
MKSVLVLLIIGVALALPPNFAALKKKARFGLNRALLRTKIDRVQSTEDSFLERTKAVTIPFLQHKITDMHNSMKTCVSDFMNEDSKDNRIEFESMVEACVGHDFSIMLRFYEETNQYAKEVVKNDLKCVLSQGLCKRRINECLEYLEVVNDFIEMDYDMEVSIKVTRKSLGRRFGRNFYDRLINLTENQLDQYNLINELLKEEKEFMEQYLSQKYREWKERHGIEYVKEVHEEEEEPLDPSEYESEYDHEDYEEPDHDVHAEDTPTEGEIYADAGDNGDDAGDSSANPADNFD